METNQLKPIKISVNKLTKNMIIATDILNNQGKKLVSAGYQVKTPARVRDLLENHKIQIIEINSTQGNARIPMDIFSENQSDQLITDEQNFPVPDAKDMALTNTLEEEILCFKEVFPSTKQRINDDFNTILYGKPLTHEKLKEHTKEHLKIFNLRTNIFQLIETMRKIDDSIYTQCYNIALTSYMIGKWIGLSEKDLEELFLAGILTDIGKLNVPKPLLDKKDFLTHKEQMEIDKHVIYSYNLIKQYPCIPNKIKQAVLTHHEKMNSTGYPFKLKGSDLSLYSRIIAISDVYNTLTTKNLENTTVFDTIKHMEIAYKNTLDTNILYTFLNRIGNCFIGQRIRLANKEMGEIIFINNHHLNKPLIKLECNNEIIDLNRYKFPWRIQEFIM
ncbi:HD-GYP domain-containing protein [Marinisporobacter balticus]|uniref:HD domain-containing protein n=1 Tax=Marinisporobacter balticus TaxID=2018667 RepID=A0A4R2KJH3_9FIRM|nr:HD domain-containing phosphohydrolase [Marinisporobacter balticus]TCO72672.1 HD domain-containing protein [Marinisporobacter balticus]